MAKRIKSFISVAIADYPLDAFRKDTGNYWVNGNHGQLLTPEEKRVDMKFEKMQIFKIKDAPFFNTRQEIKITGNSELFASEQEWMDYVQNTYMQNQKFEDFVFEADELISKNNQSIGNKQAYYGEIDFMYNFYVRAYEFMLSMPQIPENVLPNIYAEISSDFPKVDPFFDNLITGFGVTTKDKVKINNLAKQQRRPTPKMKQKEELYGRIAKKMARTGGQNRTQIQGRFSNIFFPMENLDILNDIESRMALFPMATKIEFRTDSRTEFAQILKDSKLSSSFLKYISLLLRTPTTSQERQLQSKFKLAPYVAKIGFLNTPDDTANDTPDSGAGSIWGEASDNAASPGQNMLKPPTREFDLFGWWEDFLEGRLSIPGSDKKEIFMGEQCQSVMTARDVQASFAKILSLLVFSGKLQVLIKNKMRSYAEISNGEKCYTEVAGYRIAKYIGNDKGAPIQNIWFPNSNEIDIIQYFDTQVKYDKEYTYVIYAYTLVLGSQYDYSDLIFISDIESENSAANVITEDKSILTTLPRNISSSTQGTAPQKVLIEGQDIPKISTPSPFYKILNPTKGQKHILLDRPNATPQESHIGRCFIPRLNHPGLTFL